jgi:hypothetical protein
MDLIFNELSFRDFFPDVHSSKMAMENLLQVCRRAAEFGINKLAIRPDFYQQLLTDQYNILGWLADSTVSRIYKDLLQSIVRYPYIDDKDTTIEDRFIQSNACLIDDENVTAEGLAIAYLYNTIGISLYSAERWNRKEFDLKFIEENAPDHLVKVKHASQVSHVESHKDWLASRIGVKLITTDRPFSEKPIKLRDDHGKDILLKFCIKLVRSPYLIGVINSIQFNSYDHHFIKNSYPDGKIEIVLVRTDEGFGVVVQTTGRNLAETQTIAKLLMEEFHDKY